MRRRGSKTNRAVVPSVVQQENNSVMATRDPLPKRGSGPCTERFVPTVGKKPKCPFNPAGTGRCIVGIVFHRSVADIN